MQNFKNILRINPKLRFCKAYCEVLTGSFNETQQIQHYVEHIHGGPDPRARKRGTDVPRLL